MYFKKTKSFFITTAIFILVVFVSIPHLSNPHFFAPDADRIAMDGVFLLDFIKDLPGSIMNLYEYTITYYAKYPALSIGYRPIVFQLVEAAFYFVFGYSYLSAKMAGLLFLFVGMFFWHQLIKEVYNSSYALISLLLWLTNPMVYKYAQLTALEIPTLSMCIVCMYYLHKYESNPSRFYAVALGIIVVLALWTNQKSGFLLALILLYPIAKKNAALLISKTTIASGFIILIGLVPLILITLKFGSQNLSQSIGLTDLNWQQYELDYFKNIFYLYRFHFSGIMLILILIGMISSFIARDGRCLMFVSCILCVYLFFTIIKVKAPRYSMYWIPCFSIFACIGLEKTVCCLNNLLKIKRAYLKQLIYALPILFQLSLFPDVSVGYARGYEQAAEYVLYNTKSPVIFFHGWANGQFIFFIRKHDPDMNAIVLRGSKTITSSSIVYSNKLQVHLIDTHQIYKYLLDNDAHFVVVESKNTSGLTIYDDLRQLLRDNSRFKFHRSIPVDSNISKLADQQLLIYENRRYKSSFTQNRFLNLRVPAMGKTIHIGL